jgi:hypothetical protein
LNLKLNLKAIAIIPRINGFFELSNSVTFKSYGFRGFTPKRVKAFYPGDGYGVALVLESSQVDLDFQASVFFLASDSVEKIHEAFQLSDRLTEQLLKRPWGGVRPFAMVHHFC